MNLFQKYGIKEVADVVFYSINEIGDEVFYTPVLFLDTLKVSTIEKTAEKVSAQGGYANKKLITWNYGKEITLNLEDALFSPASMSMIWGGTLQSELTDYTNAIVKGNLANKYGQLHYSIKAFPSPALSDNEWEVIFSAANKVGYKSGSEMFNDHVYVLPENGETGYVAANRQKLIDNYYLRQQELIDQKGKIYKGALPDEIIKEIINEIDTLDKLGHIRTDFHELEVIDRWEKCIVKNKEGFTISANKQRQNLFRYYSDDRSSSYTIFYDAKTMLPLLPIKDGILSGISSKKPQTITTTLNLTYPIEDLPLNVQKLIPKQTSAFNNSAYTEYLNSLKLNVKTFWKDFYQLQTSKKVAEVLSGMGITENYEILNMENNTGEQGVSFNITGSEKNQRLMTIKAVKITVQVIPPEEDLFKLKIGTIYYKWTRTVKYKEDEDDGILGRTLVINADTFPDNYKIVGETYIREYKTGKDQRYQFVIHKANVSSDTNISLQAEGDPTTFSMSIDVLTPPNDIMMELKQIDVEEDKIEGGTRIIPQRSKYTYTPTNIEMIEEIDIENNEIY